MKITKFGHCCLLIKEQGLTILTDPGAWTTGQNEVKNIDIVLITHEHVDHFHVDSVKKIIENNPKVLIITNSAVGKLLAKGNIAFEVLEHGGLKNVNGLQLEGIGEKHEVIYEEYGQVLNTGFFIANKLFYPGDAFTNPGKPVDILALPAAGPWMKISEVINYAKEVKPRVAFPVHDAILSPFGGFIHKLLETFLKPAGIDFWLAENQEEREF